MHPRRWFSLPIILAFAAAACSPTAPPPASDTIPITTSSEAARAAYLEGRTLLESLRATDAREHFARAAELDPEFALAHLGLANTAPSAAEFFAALDRAVAAAAQASEGERLQIQAFAAGVNGEPARQKELLSALVAAFPNDPRAVNALAGYYFGRQEWAEAAGRYRRATELEPSFSQAYNQLGYALRFEGDYAGAEAAFQHYVELIPDEPNPYDSYAELLMKMGRFDESIARYRQALERNPQFVASYVGIALDQTLLGDGDAARATLAELESIARNDGERRAACFQGAVSRLHLGDFEGALQELARQQAIAEASGDLAAVAGDLNLTGNVLLTMGRADDALARFEDGLAKSDASNATPEVKAAARRNHDFDLGRVQLARGDVAQAGETAAHYAAATEASGVAFERWQAHHLSALVALARGDAEGALAELEHANQQDPRVLLARARALRAAGRHDEALAACIQGAEFNGLGFNYALAHPPIRELMVELGGS